jgi:hypothetical protein
VTAAEKGGDGLPAGGRLRFPCKTKRVVGKNIWVVTYGPTGMGSGRGDLGNQQLWGCSR